MGNNKLPSAEIRTTSNVYAQSHRPFVSGNDQLSKRRTGFSRVTGKEMGL